jgi:hypothetical protein
LICIVKRGVIDDGRNILTYSVDRRLEDDDNDNDKDGVCISTVAMPKWQGP